MTLALFLLVGCGIGTGDDVSGWPDVDLGAEVAVYKTTDERDLHLHIFAAEGDQRATPGAVMFFHGGGFRSTRVEQFERQANAAAAAGITGIVVEYRVTAEGTTRLDAIADGADALAAVRSNAQRFGVDPTRIALAGSSAGGALAVEAALRERADALVLFNPAVGPEGVDGLGPQPLVVFHSREDTIVPFTSVESFCNAAEDCTLVAFDEGDHGFFNDEPAFTETTDAMIDFLQSNGWNLEPNEQ